MGGCSCRVFSPARARVSFLLLLFMTWASTGFFLLVAPGADAADLPDVSSLCAAKCGTCPVVCATPPPPQSNAIRQLPPPSPPPPKKSGQPPPATPPPPAGGQRGLSSPYYYFYTASAAPRGLPSLVATECLLPLVLLLLFSGLVVFFL